MKRSLGKNQAGQSSDEDIYEDTGEGYNYLKMAILGDKEDKTVPQTDPVEDFQAWWKNIRYFHPQDFDCPNNPGTGQDMDKRLVEMLDSLREACDFPLYVTKGGGYRTTEYNMAVGGVEESAHCMGLAVDVACIDSSKRDTILKESFNVGFTRRGIYERHIHLDVDDGKAQDVTWFGQYKT